jgi:hypothetical protein
VEAQWAPPKALPSLLSTAATAAADLVDSAVVHPKLVAQALRSMYRRQTASEPHRSKYRLTGTCTHFFFLSLSLFSHPSHRLFCFVSPSHLPRLSVCGARFSPPLGASSLFSLGVDRFFSSSASVAIPLSHADKRNRFLACYCLKKEPKACQPVTCVLDGLFIVIVVSFLCVYLRVALFSSRRFI